MKGSSGNSKEPTLTVQFSPHFLRKLGDYLRDFPIPNGEQPETLGLLFGAAAQKDPIVQSFQILPLPESPQSSLTAGYSRAFEEWRMRSKGDPELTWLDLLGWFSIRRESAAGLLESDIEFHNAHFLDASKLAIIFQPRTIDLITADFYASLPNFPLLMERHRFGSVHVSMEPTGSGRIKPVVREKMNDDFFLRAYEVAGALERAEKRAEWKDRLRAIARFEWLGFGRRE